MSGQEASALLAAMARIKIPSASGPSTCIIMHLYIASRMHASAAYGERAERSMLRWQALRVPRSGDRAAVAR